VLKVIARYVKIFQNVMSLRIKLRKRKTASSFDESVAEVKICYEYKTNFFLLRNLISFDR